MVQTTVGWYMKMAILQTQFQKVKNFFIQWASAAIH